MRLAPSWKVYLVTGGAAVADILFGKTNPSGKLAESFALEQQDIPSDNWFSGTGRQVQHREGLYVGYRYFDSANKEVLFRLVTG